MRKYLLCLLLVLGAAFSAPAQRPCALVAGGSRGIGYAIAEALARRGWDLILVARHLPDLEAAERKLEEAHHIRVDIISQDLSQEDAPGRLSAWCDAHDTRLRMLCNVAGFGGERDFGQLPADTLRYMLRLNIESTVLLTEALLPRMKAAARTERCYILNVASMAALAPMPIKNLYAATKSAVLYFSYALHYQLRRDNISVSCLAPGPVYTKPEVVATTRKALGKGFGDWMEVPPARVGEVAVRRTLRGKMLIVPGTVASVSSAFIRILPRKWVAAIYARGL